MTAETLSQVEVKVYWMHRNDYEWRLVRWGNVIANGRAASYSEAKEAGEQARTRRDIDAVRAPEPPQLVVLGPFSILSEG